MDFAANKLNNFTHKIIDLRDQPNMQPDDLKAYFDSSPEEVRLAHNGLCDSLAAVDAAERIGFQRTATVPADTVQAAVENVQSQLDAAVMGNIPSGSVTNDKLAQDVRDHFTAIETAASTEASTRASADNAEASARSAADINLQNQINTHSAQIAAKCEIRTGTYVGNSSNFPSSQSIYLGFRPKAVLVLYLGFLIEQGFNSSTYNPYGGLVIDGWSNGSIKITDAGFDVYNFLDPLEAPDITYCNLNRKDYTYVYLAFK